MATPVLRPVHGVLATAFALLLAWLDVVGYVQAVRWLCGRVGVIKALAFSLVLRWHFLAPWEDAKRATQWAAMDTSDFFLFDPTPGQPSSTLSQGFLFIPGAHNVWRELRKHIYRDLLFLSWA